MHEDVVKVECRFDLTDQEIAAAARKRAALEIELGKLESAFGIEKEKHKNAVAKLEGAAGALADLIRKGYELRPTDCRVEFAYDAGEVRTVRLDTGDVVKSRPMTEGEKGKGPRLPFGPAISLDESDPDVQAAKAAEKKASQGAEAATVAPQGGEPAPQGSVSAPADDLVHELMHGTADKPAFKAALNRAIPEQLEQALGYGALSRSAKRAIKGEMALRGINPAKATQAPAAKAAESGQVEQDARPVEQEGPSVQQEGPPVNESGAPVNAVAKDCSNPNCGHLRIYHEVNGCVLPGCHCPAFREAGEYRIDQEQPPDVLCQCGHAERVHGDTGLRGCMNEECECRKFRAPLADPDPLGIAGYPKEEKGKAGDATP